MRFEIEKTLEQGGEIEADLILGGLEWDGGAPLETGPSHVRGHLERARVGCEFDAQLTGTVTLECVRCLERFPHQVDSPFHLTFVKKEVPAHSGESKIEDADCDLYPAPDGRVDLDAIVREQLYLQIPLKPVCAASCRGLCKTCGENLNRGPCRCVRPDSVRVV